jgi:hypothetical protein
VLSLLRPGKRPSGQNGAFSRRESVGCDIKSLPEEVEQILRHVIGRIRRNRPAVRPTSGTK